METAIMVLVVLVIAIGTVAYVSKVKAPQDKARRRAESKVKMSDPILRADIEILERSNSDLAGDAIALRRSQIAQGSHPDSPPSFVVDEIEDDHVVQKLEEFFVEANLSFDKEFLITMEIGDTGTATCQLKGFELDFLLRFDCR